MNILPLMQFINYSYDVSSSYLGGNSVLCGGVDHFERVMAYGWVSILEVCCFFQNEFFRILHFHEVDRRHG